MTVSKITEVALDPVWEVGTVTLDEGQQMPFLRMTHPRFGEMVFSIPKLSMEKMIEAMTGALSRLEIKPTH